MKKIDILSFTLAEALSLKLKKVYIKQLVTHDINKLKEATDAQLEVANRCAKLFDMGYLVSVIDFLLKNKGYIESFNRSGILPNEFKQNIIQETKKDYREYSMISIEEENTNEGDRKIISDIIVTKRYIEHRREDEAKKINNK